MDGCQSFEPDSLSTTVRRQYVRTVHCDEDESDCMVLIDFILCINKSDVAQMGVASSAFVELVWSAGVFRPRVVAAVH
ncbi:unnamed protein product [Strongylus vulgaris]|uniref:Uncharacterized protein n=1 Tax=Strongylus vulgaris TaxID=40348 RepID=A0A3P7L7E7_STRVU|nr:unnamed protein product [Strongylus vulgaris]